MRSNLVAPYAAALIKLLQAPIFSDDAGLWNLFFQYQHAIQQYFAQMGMEVLVYEADGFAFLHQPDLEDEEGHPLMLPRLTRRDHLPFYPTVLCALLRERLDRFEATDLHANRCLITAEEIWELLLPFFPPQTDERGTRQKIESATRRLVDLGFLKPLDLLDESPTYEVRRILKARVNAEQLADIWERVARHADQQP